MKLRIPNFFANYLSFCDHPRIVTRNPEIVSPLQHDQFFQSMRYYRGDSKDVFYKGAATYFEFFAEMRERMKRLKIISYISKKPLEMQVEIFRIQETMANPNARLFDIEDDIFDHLKLDRNHEGKAMNIEVDNKQRIQEMIYHYPHIKIVDVMDDLETHLENSFDMELRIAMGIISKFLIRWNVSRNHLRIHDLAFYDDMIKEVRSNAILTAMFNQGIGGKPFDEEGILC